jgi:IclR family mhp operon transcriptional activator
MGDEIRSVQRALFVLRVMNERATWSLHDLHLRTRLPKSTIHRLLATLSSDGYVRSDAELAGQYRLTSEVAQLSRGITEKSELAEAATPLMIAATRAMKWPLSLGVIDGAKIRVVFCTMPYSPYAIMPSASGRRYDLKHSALGRAYLAFCRPAERRILVESTNTMAEPEDRIDDLCMLRHMVREIRRAGYAIRYANSNAESTAFAVPVFDGTELRGVLVYSTYAGLMSQRMLERFLPQVQDVAAAIGAAVGPHRALPGLPPSAE